MQAFSARLRSADQFAYLVSVDRFLICFPISVLVTFFRDIKNKSIALTMHFMLFTHTSSLIDLHVYKQLWADNTGLVASVSVDGRRSINYSICKLHLRYIFLGVTILEQGVSVSLSILMLTLAYDPILPRFFIFCCTSLCLCHAATINCKGI